jgi:hypothetical protein
MIQRMIRKAESQETQEEGNNIEQAAVIKEAKILRGLQSQEGSKEVVLLMHIFQLAF